MQDILDEFIDRFGDPPRVTVRLISISLIRALASLAEIPRVEYKGTNLVFRISKPELSIWSELFGKHKGLSFRSLGDPSVVIRARSADEAINTAISVLTDYYLIFCEMQSQNTKDNEEEK